MYVDSREGFDDSERDAWEYDRIFDENDGPDDQWYDDEDEDDWEDDGQPSEYDEWQDYYGGDDWDHGQYDDY